MYRFFMYSPLHCHEFIDLNAETQYDHLVAQYERSARVFREWTQDAEDTPEDNSKIYIKNSIDNNFTSVDVLLDVINASQQDFANSNSTNCAAHFDAMLSSDDRNLSSNATPGGSTNAAPSTVPEPTTVPEPSRVSRASARSPRRDNSDLITTRNENQASCSRPALNGPGSSTSRRSPQQLTFANYFSRSNNNRTSSDTAIDRIRIYGEVFPSISDLVLGDGMQLEAESPPFSNILRGVPFNPLTVQDCSDEECTLHARSYDEFLRRTDEELLLDVEFGRNTNVGAGGTGRLGTGINPIPGLGTNSISSANLEAYRTPSMAATSTSNVEKYLALCTQDLLSHSKKRSLTPSAGAYSIPSMETALTPSMETTLTPNKNSMLNMQVTSTSYMEDTSSSYIEGTSTSRIETISIPNMAATLIPSMEINVNSRNQQNQYAAIADDLDSDTKKNKNEKDNSQDNESVQEESQCTENVVQNCGDNDMHIGSDIYFNNDRISAEYDN